MDKNAKKFSEGFIRRLGYFVDKEKERAKQKEITDVEFRAIVSTAFNLLGKHSKRFTEVAGLD